MLLLIIALPLTSAMISGFFGFTIGKQGSKILSVVYNLSATICAYILFVDIGLKRNIHYIETFN
jgi:NADH:ubiquinone oxidoreductase subunit 5 (subunit L)/multisubunit Na+/H+ antiporter MnhA subunit